MGHIEVWKFLAGLGIFLYGMGQLEKVLRTATGRSLKLFLKRNTQNTLKAIAGGAAVTAVIQSSTVVSLIVLAFVESGIITFKNALAVILGANLGTTITGWVVVMLGFKLDATEYALPLLAITSLGMFFTENRKNAYNLFLSFFSIGILFLGLGFMKDGAQQMVTEFDLKPYAHLGTFIFVIIGFFLTAIIQSSSATVALTLTALHTGIIPFSSATAIVIGSEVGTTLTILFGGIKGSSNKKRTAWGNFFYNFFMATLAYVFLPVIIHFIENIVHIHDPLVGLMFFQSFINFTGILLWAPFLKIIANQLEKLFADHHHNNESYITKNLSILPLLATDAMRNEALNLFKKTLSFNRHILCYHQQNEEGLLHNFKSFIPSYEDVQKKYNRLKQTEGDILEYYVSLHESNIKKEDAILMVQYLNGVRQSVFAAKAIKDIAHNLSEFNNSANDIKYAQRAIIHDEWKAFDNKLNKLLNLSDKQEIKTEIEKIMNDVLTQEEQQKSAIILHLKNNLLNEVETSTLMNVHRELLSCKKSLLQALQNLEIETPPDNARGRLI